MLDCYHYLSSVIGEDLFIYTFDKDDGNINTNQNVNNKRDIKQLQEL